MTNEFPCSAAFLKCVCTLLFAVHAGMSAAADSTAVGRWKQIDDEDGKLLSIIRIEEHAGLFEGSIEKIFPEAGEDPDPVCNKCPGARKGQKVIGMKIVTGLKRSGPGYEGGEILDPDNGRLYRARMSLAPDGKSLEVRGFIGLAVFGRSQIWLRQE